MKSMILALLFPVCALATNTPNPPPFDTEPTNITVGAKSASVAAAASTSTSQASSDATASATQTQTASGSAEQSQSANNEGVTTSTNVTSEYRRAAASANAPAVYASNVCAIGWSIGGQLPGVGASGGKTRVDPDCNLRENIRIVASLNPALALKVACTLAGVREVATAEDCAYQVPVPPVAGSSYPAPSNEGAGSAAAAPDLSKYATKDELDRAFQRSLAK